MDPAVPLSELIPPPSEQNDTNKVYSIAVACIVLAIITTSVVVLRLSYRFSRKILGIDDYAIAPSLILYLGLTALAVWANLDAGVGKPLTEVTLAEYTKWYQSLYAVSFIYPVTSAAIRVSIILFYHRIFSIRHNRGTKYFLWLLAGLQGVYAIVFCALMSLVCTSFAHAADPIERLSYCDGVVWNYLILGLYATSLAFDVILLIFPIGPILKLQASLKKRVGIMLIFVLGTAACIATAYKLGVYVDRESQTTVRGVPNWFEYMVSRVVPPQFEDYGVTVWIPSQVETSVALIGASLPAIYPILKDGFLRTRSIVSAGSSGLKRSAGKRNTSESVVQGRPESEHELHPFEHGYRHV